MKLFLLCALALFACAYARTVTHTQNVAPHITSLTDKDARIKASTHPAFANAGRQAGVEIWRIENFDPVPVAAKDYGKFHKGDSYIVLKTTTDKRGNLSWDIHYWIGSESTQDESGAAAILTVGLDDKFSGAAVQHREPMGYESQQFKGYFSSPLVYLDGGVASGFHHVTTNAGAEKRLVQVKGKRNIRVRQVDPVISSMNKGDVFILDKDNDIYVYVGDKASRLEKLKAISVANQIRDQDHHGRGKIDIVDQYSSEVDVQKFFTALGSGSKDLVPEDTAGGDDSQFEKNEEQAVNLYEVSENGGKVKVTPLPKPFRQEQLKPQDAYILDTVSGSIYVWTGKQATEKEKTEAMAKAQEFRNTKKYPAWVQVTRIPQNTEPAIFKQYFTTWRDVGMSHSRIVRSAGNSDAEHFKKPVSRGFTHSRLFRVYVGSDNKIEFKEVDFEKSSLKSDQIFLIDIPNSNSIYLWIGDDIPEQKRKAAEFITHAYINDEDDTINKYVVVQDEQPDDFVKSLGLDIKVPNPSVKSDSFENNEIDVY